MTYAEEATIQSTRLVRAIASDPDITPATKKTTQEYADYMKARGLTDRTIQKNLYCLSNFYKVMGRKDVLKLTKEDVMKAMAQLERSRYSVKTRQNIKIVVRLLFKHFLGEDEYHPEQTRWIKATVQERKRVLPEDVLSEEDILKLLNVTNDVRDKALIALIYDSGMRVGELLNMKIRDCDLKGALGHVIVDGKTGMRKIPIMFSAPYLGAYLNTLKNKKPVDFLWNARGSWSNINHPIDRAGVAKVFRIAAAKAGISKRINPHSFRHARATYYANRLTEQQLKQFFGWTADSRMASTYVHLSGRDLDNKVMEVNGLKPQELEEPKLKVQMCPKCRESNGTDMQFCGHCGSALSIETALEQQADEERMSKRKEEYIRDPSKFMKEAIESYFHEVLLAQHARITKKRQD